MSLKGKTVFVTGGSGFIGGRLIESLIVDHGAHVRALVHRAFAGALRMARFDIEFVSQSITDIDAMTQATRGCDVVFHLAYGSGGTESEQGKITVEGTRTLAQAALQNDVNRFVNVSTAAVYGNKVDGTIDETTPRKPWGWHYSDTKLEAENIVLDMHRDSGLPATIMQVAGVYGPWGEVFTIAPLVQLAAGIVPLVEGGVGISNATYVDDVVQALILGAVHEKAVGEIFLVKGPGKVTRRELYESYQSMLGSDSLVSMTLAEIAAARRREKRSGLRRIAPSLLKALAGSAELKSALRQSPFAPALIYSRDHLPAAIVRRLRGNPAGASAPAASAPGDAAPENRPLFLPPPFFTRYLAAKTDYSTAKIKKYLGFKPAYPLEAGMAATREWARWNGLAP